MINIALEKSINLWKHYIKYTLMLDWYKIKAHKHLFAVLGPIVSRKFGNSQISQKVRENTTLAPYNYEVDYYF